MGWAGERALKINEIWMLERDKKSLKIWWFSLPTSRKRERNTLRKTLFFSLVFCNRFGVGFGRVLRGVWSLLGPLGPVFGVFFWGLYSLEGTELVLGSILEGTELDLAPFWEVWSWILAPFWKVLNWISAPFWRVVWEWSGEDFGRVLGEFGGLQVAVFLEYRIR